MDFNEHFGPPSHFQWLRLIERTNCRLSLTFPWNRPVFEQAFLDVALLLLLVILDVIGRRRRRLQCARLIDEPPDVSTDSEAELASTVQQQLNDGTTRRTVRFRQLQQQIRGVFETLF